MLLLCRLCWIALGVALGYYYSSPFAAAQGMPGLPSSGTGDCAGVPAMECGVRKAKCLPVSTLMQGSGGPVGAVFTCATQLAIPKTQIIPVLGPAFSSGQPETIVDRISNDTQITLRMRRCILMNAGLLGLNDTINREALVGKAQASLSWNPPLAAIVATAVRGCPEPDDLKYNELLSCVRQRCVGSVSVAAFAYPPPGGGSKGKCSKKKGCKKH